MKLWDTGEDSCTIQNPSRTGQASSSSSSSSNRLATALAIQTLALPDQAKELSDDGAIRHESDSDGSGGDGNASPPRGRQFINSTSMRNVKEFSTRLRNVGFLATVLVSLVTITIFLLGRHQDVSTWAKQFGLLGSSETTKRAFATYLTGGGENYLTAARILTYQVLHAPETRTLEDYPLVVFVEESVPREHRSRLIKDGASVVQLKHLGSDWVTPTWSRWANVMTKLRIWERTEYDLIAFLDADTLLLQNVDSVFEDAAVQELDPLPHVPRKENAPQWEPESYVMTGIVQINEDHDWPPLHVPHDRPNPTFFNAGLMVFRPDKQVFRYYEEVLNTPDSFDPGLPEQGLLNWVHDRDGRLPATLLDYRWNAQYGSAADVEGGVAMLHDKWWNLTNPDGGVQELFLAWKARMEAFYACREAAILHVAC